VSTRPSELTTDAGLHLAGLAADAADAALTDQLLTHLTCRVKVLGDGGFRLPNAAYRTRTVPSLTSSPPTPLPPVTVAIFFAFES
jgi:hypothetical protein